MSKSHTAAFQFCGYVIRNTSSLIITVVHRFVFAAPGTAPDFTLSSKADNITFKSTLTVDINGMSMSILEHNGIVTAYQAEVIQVGASMGAPKTERTSVSGHIRGMHPSNAMIDFTDLLPNTNYTVRVRAGTMNSAGAVLYGNYSETKTTATPETSKCVSFMHHPFPNPPLEV